MESQTAIGNREVAGTEPTLAPLVLATMASQALLVVLSPTIVAIGKDLGASVGAVGQARSVAAGVAILASIAAFGRIDALGVRRLLCLGSALAIAASAAVALAPTLAVSSPPTCWWGSPSPAFSRPALAV
jgi:predicted MFS family arabinose efflux permease